MKAAVNRTYGPAETVKLVDMPTPAPGPREVLIRVDASSVTTADWRMRAAAFPAPFRLAGRLMTGLLRPRDTVRGTDVAGRVVATGHAVTRFKPGDPVFGFIGHGAHAEYALARDEAALIKRPASMSAQDAAALPFGGLAALVFLRDVAKLQRGQRVLIVGGSGGVGSYAVQIARCLGAHVTAVASAEHGPWMRELGAHDVIDYRTQNMTQTDTPYDVVFDTVGVTSLKGMRHALVPDGLFLPLNFGTREIWQALTQRFRRGPRIALHVNADRAEDLQWLVDRICEGTLKPVIDTVYPLADIVTAYRHVESRHRRGAVVLDLAGKYADRRCA